MNKNELISKTIAELLVLPMVQKDILPRLQQLRIDTLSGCPISLIIDEFDDIEKLVNKCDKLKYYCKLIVSNPWVLYDQYALDINWINTLIDQFAQMDMFVQMNREKIVKLSVTKSIIDNM